MGSYILQDESTGKWLAKEQKYISYAQKIKEKKKVLVISAFFK